VIPITRPRLPPLEEYTTLLEEVWSSRMLSNFSRYARDLEAMTSGYLAVPTRVTVSGDIGMTLTIAALELPRGATALVPSFTFNSTVNAILWNGLAPIFAEIDATTFNLDAVALALLAERHRPALIVATHVFGNPADVDGIARVAAEHGARLVFDAAHGYGAKRASVHVGGFGDAEVFSLSGTKPVTSAEGGLVASNDEALLERVTYLRGYGFRNDYNSRYVGLNGKMSELHAALGLLTMRRVDEALIRREAIVAVYHERLGVLPGVEFQRVRPEDRTTYKDFALLFQSGGARDRVEAALAAAEVQTKRYFRPCHGMDAFRRYADRPLAVTEDVHARILCIPLFEDLTSGEIDLICGTIQATLSAGRA
jgi:dTDP-4-amino-4,6-dideoxygalactose transaminase